MRDYQYEACRILVSVLQARAPYDTGNLALNSIRIAPDHSAVLIGGVDIAPYAVYTNKPWISPKWNGKKNPNENWVTKAIHEATPLIQQALGGKMTKKDYDALMADYKSIYNRRKRIRARFLKDKKEKI